MRNSPASGWRGCRVPPPPPPPQRPPAVSFGLPMINRPDAHLPLQPHRTPYNAPAQERGAQGGEPDLLDGLSAPSIMLTTGASGAAEAMTHPMPGSAGLGSALSYASSYLLDANLGLDAGPRTALDSLPLAPLSAAAGETV